MNAPEVEHGGLIGDGSGAALIHRNGAVAWLCWPRLYVETVGAIPHSSGSRPFVRRYDSKQDKAGAGGPERAFPPCSFWLADNLILQNHGDEAAAICEQMPASCNGIALIPEEYGVIEKRVRDHFPQALTHFRLIHTARNPQRNGPMHRRSASAYRRTQE